MLQQITQVLKSTPNIKAKGISKEIGQDKKLVNKFLHAHPDNFVQDNKYRWSLVAAELNIEFDNHWVNRNSFERTLTKDGSPLDCEYNSVCFILPENCKIMLDAAARLLALCNQMVNDSKKVKIDFTACKTTLSYFSRIGFIDHLDDRVELEPARPLSSKASAYRGKSTAVVEFGAIDPRTLNKALINQLTDRFVQKSSDIYDTAASTIFGELIGNVQEHSKAEIPGFAALQIYENNRRIQIQTVISDSGLGIPATLVPSLKDHYPDLYNLRNKDDFHLLLVEAVITKGEISRYGSGRGLGFKSSREQAAKFNARLSVRQDNFSLDMLYKNGILQRIFKKRALSTIHGTHICFDFFVDYDT